MVRFMALTPTGTRTPVQRLADAALGLPVEEWLLARRTEGKSWRLIERELIRAADLDLTTITLRAWLKAHQARVAAYVARKAS